MKRKTIQATLLSAMIGLSVSNAAAADYKQNPFTLTYEGAITKNEPGEGQHPPGHLQAQRPGHRRQRLHPARTTTRRRNIPRSSWRTRTAA